MAVIQSINFTKMKKPLIEIKQDRGVTTFYHLAQDATSSALASLDFQAGDRVEVDASVYPTMEDVLVMLTRNGAPVLVSLDEADECRHMKYVGVVVTHMRIWSEGRRAKGQPTRSLHTSGSLATAVATLVNFASFRFAFLLQLAWT